MIGQRGEIQTIYILLFGNLCQHIHFYVYNVVHRRIGALLSLLLELGHASIGKNRLSSDPKAKKC